MARSYNRWMAERTARFRRPSLGGTRSCAHDGSPLEEIEFGRQNGAVSVFLIGFPHDLSIRNYLHPIR